ncbi:MAG: histidinol-phosphate transaminase [bacterium]
MKDSPKTRASRIVRSDIQRMSAYHVQNAEGMVKLDAMENPWAWPGDQAGWPEAIANVQANRYPDPGAGGVIRRLRDVMAIPDAMDVVLGNGSDELIQLLIQMVAGDNVTILSPEPSFVMYRVLAETNRVEYRGVSLTADMQLDVPAMLAAINDLQPALIFLACPNNPTGIRYAESDIRQIIEAATGLVVIDEAYIAFSEDSALPLLDQYPNAVVMRTLSKVGLAGLRLGMLIGHPDWITEVDKIRLPYNIGALTQAAAEFALDRYDELLGQARELVAMREAQYLTLQDERYRLRHVWKSDANFLLVQTEEGRARYIFEGLRDQDVLIKCLDGGHPLLKDCLRLTIGTSQENRQLLAALEKVV